MRICGSTGMNCCALDGPQPEQIFTVVKMSETKMAMKSGYGESRLISTINNGVVIEITSVVLGPTAVK